MGCFRDMTYQRSTMHEATVRSLYDMMSRTATPTVARVCVAGYSVDDWRSFILLCRLVTSALILLLPVYLKWLLGRSHQWIWLSATDSDLQALLFLLTIHDSQLARVATIDTGVSTPRLLRLPLLNRPSSAAQAQRLPPVQRH